MKVYKEIGKVEQQELCERPVQMELSTDNNSVYCQNFQLQFKEFRNKIINRRTKSILVRVRHTFHDPL